MYSDNTSAVHSIWLNKLSISTLSTLFGTRQHNIHWTFYPLQLTNKNMALFIKTLITTFTATDKCISDVFCDITIIICKCEYFICFYYFKICKSWTLFWSFVLYIYECMYLCGNIVLGIETFLSTYKNTMCLPSIIHTTITTWITGSIHRNLAA